MIGCGESNFSELSEPRFSFSNFANCSESWATTKPFYSAWSPSFTDVLLFEAFKGQLSGDTGRVAPQRLESIGDNSRKARAPLSLVYSADADQIDTKQQLESNFLSAILSDWTFGPQSGAYFLVRLLASIGT